MAVAEPLGSGEEPQVLGDANAQQADALFEPGLLGKGSQDGGEAQAGFVTSGKRFKPMCYYYTQGLCTLVRVLVFTIQHFSRLKYDLVSKCED